LVHEYTCEFTKGFFDIGSRIRISDSQDLVDISGYYMDGFMGFRADPAGVLIPMDIDIGIRVSGEVVIYYSIV